MAIRKLFILFSIIVEKFYWCSSIQTNFKTADQLFADFFWDFSFLWLEGVFVTNSLQILYQSKVGHSKMLRLLPVIR